MKVFYIGQNLSKDSVGDCILTGDQSNFKSYGHVVRHVSAANVRTLFAKPTPKF
jgi:hypothetical protein